MVTMPTTARFTSLALLLGLLALPAGCMQFEYDLAPLRVPVSAKPAGPGVVQLEPFSIETKDVLWVHGLFGRDEPDVAELVAGRAEGFDRVADFRVSHGATFHDWLVTHLTLTLVRMKTVTIEGDLVRDGPGAP